jgi:hypothetical protein
MPAAGVRDRKAKLMPRHHHIRQQHHRLVVAPGHQIGDDGHFGDVESAVAHHGLEALVGRRVVREVQFDEIRVIAPDFNAAVCG